MPTPSALVRISLLPVLASLLWRILAFDPIPITARPQIRSAPASRWNDHRRRECPPHRRSMRRLRGFCAPSSGESCPPAFAWARFMRIAVTAKRNAPMRAGRNAIRRWPRHWAREIRSRRRQVSVERTSPRASGAVLANTVPVWSAVFYVNINRHVSDRIASLPASYMLQCTRRRLLHIEVVQRYSYAI